jgi:hypothetical protein
VRSAAERGRERVRLAAARVEGAVAAAGEQPYRRAAVGEPGSKLAAAVGQRLHVSALLLDDPEQPPGVEYADRDLLRWMAFPQASARVAAHHHQVLGVH